MLPPQARPDAHKPHESRCRRHCTRPVLRHRRLAAGSHSHGLPCVRHRSGATHGRLLRENLDWLSEQFNTAHNFKLDAGDATSYQWSGTIDAVATETYLGRPFTEQPTGELIAQTSAEVNLILKKFLKNLMVSSRPAHLSAWPSPPGPSAKTSSNTYPLVDQIDDLGYNRVRFEHARDADLLYYREDQYTARELLVLTRK
ncbi:MAG: hypothetical protein WDN27_06820 [Candidatus Saccharibacteria bacterium]